jgi:hypothetical protein
MNGTVTFRPVERRAAIRIKAPQASEQECLQAELIEEVELIEQTELLDAHASDIRHMCAELNKESLSACGWMGDLPRYLEDQAPSRHRVPGDSALLTTDLPALDRRGVAVLFAVTLVPWLLVALLVYLCWSLIP